MQRCWRRVDGWSNWLGTKCAMLSAMPSFRHKQLVFFIFSHVPAAWFAEWIPLSKHHCALKGIYAVYSQACKQFMLWCFDFWYGFGCHRKDHQQFGPDSMHRRFQYCICSCNLSYAYVLVSAPKALISLNKHYSGFIVYIYMFFFKIYTYFLQKKMPGSTGFASYVWNSQDSCFVFPDETGTYTEETNKTCQQLIRDNLQWCNLVTSRFRPAPCMFGEVEGCVPTTAMRSDDDFMTMFRKINNCKLIGTQWCYMHNKCCPVLGPAAAVDFNCAGLPCWDYSMAGNRKQEEGETRRVFIGYAAQHCAQRTPLLVVENVKASGLKVCDHVCQVTRFSWKHRTK